MTNLLFLGCLYAESQKDFFLKSSKRGYQSAAQNFQEALVDGFLNNIDTNTTILSIPSLSAYPKGCNLFKVDSASFLNENKEVGKAFGYINIPFLKGFHNSKIDKYIDKWYSQAAGSKVIVVYALLRNQLQYAVAAKNVILILNFVLLFRTCRCICAVTSTTRCLVYRKKTWKQ